VTRYRFFTNGSEPRVLNAIAATNHSSVPSRIRSSMIFPDDGEDDARQSKNRPEHRITSPPHAHVPISKSSQPQLRGRRRDRWIGTTGGAVEKFRTSPESCHPPDSARAGKGGFDSSQRVSRVPVSRLRENPPRRSRNDRKEPVDDREH
jgi:hypothetical protein